MSEVQPLPSPLYPLLNQINAAAASDLHLIAIGMAVALPAICASLSTEDGRSAGSHYKAWCAANLAGKEFAGITPDELYSIRCDFLHSGRGGIKTKINESNNNKMIFMPRGDVFIDCHLSGAYVYSVAEFCGNMCNAAHSWYEANRDNPVVKANSERLMQYREDGLLPHIQGVMVIA